MNILDIIQSILLGIVQGLTEFLPVSSSGHLVIFQKLLGVKDHSIAFDVAAHLGTLFTIFTVYFKTIKKVILELVRFPIHRKVTEEIWLSWLVIAASIPTAIIGLSFKDHFESLFSNIFAVGVALIVTGGLLYLTKTISNDDDIKDLNDLTPITKIKTWQAFVIGLAQSFAITPGISRSGSTIVAGLFVKLDRNTAALFSFMISIPAVLGAGVLQLKDIQVWDQGTMQSLGAGFLTAYLSGLVGLLGILHFVKRGRLQLFSVYLWVVGVSIIIWTL